MLPQDGRIDVVDPGRAQRDRLEVGQCGAHTVGETVEPDDGGVVAREVLDQLVFGERPPFGAEPGARIGCNQFSLQLGEEIEVGRGDGDTRHAAEVRALRAGERGSPHANRPPL